MAIIKKDGFEFLDDINGDPEAFIVKGENLSEEIKYINDNNIKSIYLTYFKSELVNNLRFLNEVNNIEKVNINDMDVDYSGLYYLKNLKQAILSIKNKKQYLDFYKFKKLAILSIDWYTNFPELDQNLKLRDLTIWKFRPASKSFSELKLPSNLENLKITDSNILNLKGLNFACLKKFEAHYCKTLQTVRGLNGISDDLRILVFDYCRSLNDYDEISNCKNLEKLIIGDCGDIPNLKWLKDLKKIKHFSFWNTSIADGDLSPCLGINYVSFKDSKHYNHKIKEFKRSNSN